MQHRPDFEEIIRTYAPLGEAQRLRRQRRQAVTRLALGALTLACLASLAGHYRVEIELAARNAAEIYRSSIHRTASDAKTSGSSAAQATLAPERAGLGAERAALAAERAELGAERAALAAARAALGTQRAALEAQFRALREKQIGLEREQDTFARAAAELASRNEALDRARESLRAAATQAESQRRRLTQAHAELAEQGRRLEASVADLDAKRGRLEDDRQRFRAQRKLLEREIARVSEQLATLESERARFAAERADFLADARMIASSADPVDEAALGEIRGGVDTRDNVDIAIGLSRTVDINGVEQYSSSLILPTSGAGSMTPVDVPEPVVIQNGPGNTIDPAALGSAPGTWPVIIQNTLDDQHITHTSVLDVTVGNTAVNQAHIAAGQAIDDSISLQR